MCDAAFRQKTEYLEACYESWKAVLDKFDSLLKSVRSLSPHPGDALQRLIDEAKARLAAKRDELERLYDANVELLRKGVELHDTAPIVIRLEVNWSQIVRSAWAAASDRAAADPLGLAAISTPTSDIGVPLTRSSSNSPCVFGSIGSGLAPSLSARPTDANGTASAEPFLSCFGTPGANNDAAEPPQPQPQPPPAPDNHVLAPPSTSAAAGFDASWLPGGHDADVPAAPVSFDCFAGWAGVDFTASLKEEQNRESDGVSTVATNGSVATTLFNDAATSASGAGDAPTKAPSAVTVTATTTFSSIVQSEADRTAAFEWLFSCLKDWRAKKLLSVPFDLLLEKCMADGETRLWRALQGESVEHLVGFMKTYPNVFAISADSGTVSLVMTAPGADAPPPREEEAARPMVTTKSPASAKQRRSGSLLEMDDFGNTSNSSHESASSNSMHSDDGSWQEVVKKVARSNGGKPMPPAADIRERIIDVLDLTSHGSNLSKLIAVEILRRAVKENSVPRDLTNESIDKLRLYLPNALSSARGKLARPRPSLPPEHADWTYKTKLCVQFATTRHCSMATSCRFAHGLNELRPKRRAEYCSYWKKSGTCPRRESCQYAHSPEELGQYVDRAAHSLDVAAPRSLQPAIALTVASPSQTSATEHPGATNGESSEGCWLCKGQRRGVPSKKLKCGHKYHSQCLSKFAKKQHAATTDVSTTLMPDEAVCPKCRTVAIATVAVNV